MKEVYAIEDLVNREILDAGAAKPALLAVIGDPIHHSKSPQMHQVALDEQEYNIRYIRVLVPIGKVKYALEQMEKLGFIGCNVTVPHKLEVMEACDSLTETAKALGAVNTVHFTKNGWVGHNTDGPGLSYAIQSQLNCSFSTSSTLILGAGGGAGRAIAVQAAIEKCPQLTLSNRTVGKLDSIAEKIRRLHPDCDLRLIDNSESELASVKADLIINSTSLGMKEDDPLPFPASAIQPTQVFYDAVYSPPVTSLLKVAKAAGCKVANGQGMLVYQGALSYEMWLQSEPNILLMRAEIL